MHALLLISVPFLVVGTSILSEDLLDQMQAQLTDTCGTRCTGIFSDLVPLISNITRPENEEDAARQYSLFTSFVDRIISNGREENMKILSEVHKLTPSSFANAPSVATRPIGAVAPRPPPKQPGVPCGTAAECEAMYFKVNRCSVIRQAALDAYQGANAAVSVLANLMATLCGCLFMDPANVCVLAAIPYTCGIPYQAYFGLFGVSMSLWQAVIMTTSACSVVGTDAII